MAIELDNSFTVPVPPEQAWDVLLDVERIAPCMPGASVTSVEGDEIAGQVKVKLGPLSLSYKGTARFTEKDQDNHAIAIQASGKETRGAGTASATVHASLKPAGAGETTVSIHTSLNVTGRPAQFGRSLLPEVSGKLIDQFAANLAALIDSSGAPADPAQAANPAAPAADATGAAMAAEDVTGGTTAAGGAPGAATAAGDAATTTANTAASTPAATAAPTATAPTATAPAQPTARLQQEDSLNLVKLLGGPILKRVLPVAAGVALIAVFGRRIRGLVSRSKS